MNDMIHLTEYDIEGRVTGKQTIRKRHCFTEVYTTADNEYLIIHDSQNYLEFYRVNWSKPCSFEKVYKLSVYLETPFIFLGAAISQTHYFLLAAQKDKLQIFQRDINAKIETKEPKNPIPLILELDEEQKQPKNLPSTFKQSKKIDNLSSYTLTMEMDLPESMPVDFIHSSGALFFNINDLVYRFTTNDKVLTKFDVPFSVRLKANDDGTVCYLAVNELGVIRSQGTDRTVFSEAVAAWNNWGVQQKTEMIDMECLTPNVYFVISPVDCFVVDHGQFVEGFEFAPVFIKSFKLE
jgi:hypothetical protein